MPVADDDRAVRSTLGDDGGTVRLVAPYFLDSILLAHRTYLPPKESSPWESHPQALAEPYVNLSAHTAPITQAADRKPNRQCANKPGACFAMRPSQVLPSCLSTVWAER